MWHGVIVFLYSILPPRGSLQRILSSVSLIILRGYLGSGPRSSVIVVLLTMATLRNPKYLLTSNVYDVGKTNQSPPL